MKVKYSESGRIFFFFKTLSEKDFKMDSLLRIQIYLEGNFICFNSGDFRGKGNKIPGKERVVVTEWKDIIIMKLSIG